MAHRISAAVLADRLVRAADNSWTIEAKTGYAIVQRLDQFLEVFQPPRCFGCLVVLPMRGIAGFIQNHLCQLDVIIFGHGRRSRPFHRLHPRCVVHVFENIVILRRIPRHIARAFGRYDDVVPARDGFQQQAQRSAAPALDRAMLRAPKDRTKWPLVYLSPRGKPFDQSMARKWSETDGISMLCGRFEGVDQRVLDAYDVEEVSLGDFVLSGGEIAAQAMIDAALRLRPRVLGNAASVEEESFSSGLLEHPQFTKPAEWEGRKVPDVLLSGDHAKVEAWRREEAERVTRERRSDMAQRLKAEH